MWQGHFKGSVHSWLVTVQVSTSSRKVKINNKEKYIISETNKDTRGAQQLNGICRYVIRVWKYSKGNYKKRALNKKKMKKAAKEIYGISSNEAIASCDFQRRKRKGHHLCLMNYWPGTSQSKKRVKYTYQEAQKFPNGRNQNRPKKKNPTR